MTQSELIKIKTLASRKKQFLDVLRLRIPHGEMRVFQRMQAEMFLKTIRIVADNIRQIETYNDILASRDFIQGLNKSTEREEKQVIEFILEMLNIFY